MKRLLGKIALITGGNSGIGLATAQLFARQGARVVVTARSQETLDAAVATIGHEAIGIRGDVANIQHHRDVAKMLQEKFGHIDVYMANAGILTIKPSAAVTPDEYDAQMGVNARGTFFGVQAIEPIMRPGGSIIVTSSLAASRVLDGHAVYAGAKAALESFSRSWAIEFKERRIRVNVLSPGPVDTSILAKLGVPETDRPQFLESMSQRIPTGGLGQAGDLANAALYLASDESRFVNGSILRVDGGMSLT